MDEYDRIAIDLGVDPSAFTVDIGEGPQLWSQYVQDSRDFGELAGVDFSSFVPQAFDPTGLGSVADIFPGIEWPASGTIPWEGDPLRALQVDPATGSVYDNGAEVVTGPALHGAIETAQEIKAAVEGGQAQTMPQYVGGLLKKFYDYFRPLTSQLPGGGAASTGGGDKIANALLSLLVGGGVIGLSQLLKGDDVKLTVPQGGTSQVTAAGNRAVMGALTEPGPGGGAAGTGTGGTGAGATGMENLQRAMQAALAGQKDLAVYYAEAPQKEIEMARTALGAMPAYLNPTPETLAAAGDPVSAGLLTRLQNVFGGKISNPVLEKAITDMRDQLHNRLMAGRTTSAGLGASSRDIELQRAQDFNEAALRDADYRQSVAQIVPLYNAAAREGLATRRLIAAPNQGPLSSVASIPALAGVERTDAAAAAQADREFRAALAAAQAEAASSGELSRNVLDLGMLTAGGMLFGRG